MVVLDMWIDIVELSYMVHSPADLILMTLQDSLKLIKPQSVHLTVLLFNPSDQLRKCFGILTLTCIVSN